MNFDVHFETLNWRYFFNKKLFSFSLFFFRYHRRFFFVRTIIIIATTIWIIFIRCLFVKSNISIREIFSITKILCVEFVKFVKKFRDVKFSSKFVAKFVKKKYLKRANKWTNEISFRMINWSKTQIFKNV